MDIKVKKILITALKFLPFIICFIFVIIVSASTETISSVEIDGVEYTIDMEKDTISDGEKTYDYSYSLDKWYEYDVDIFYPDGAQFTYFQRGIKGGCVYEKSVPGVNYDNADALFEVAKLDAPYKPWHIVIILIIVSMPFVLIPKNVALALLGWMFENPKLKKEGIVATCIFGILLLLTAVGFSVYFLRM
ncbi:MAG: hypothetical protein IJ031_03100 [Oscillospiraceae bacterium]|nr:hypothetical protein [Oscillospiraceae bacterium]MBQ8883566.1 hypothetical protein [Oscillospiraceae bacterium]